ncbi:MAG: prepilin peptidase [Candidatus Rokuibacteriota bacterium]
MLEASFLPGLAAVVLVGLLVGSFLNVVITRLPERRSLWAPRSACPGCGATIAWHDNVPVLSFVALRGRCRACAMPIAWRYPVVEVTTAGLFALAYSVFGLTPDLGVALILLAALVAITGIDLQHQIIPDVITLTGTVAGFVANLATGRVGWSESLLGILVGGGSFLAIILASGGGMGGGDMKLGAMLGAFLGWKVTLLAILVAVVLGGIVAGILLTTGLRRRKDPVPFGPFLALGGAVGLLWGDRLVNWYLTAFQA